MACACVTWANRDIFRIHRCTCFPPTTGSAAIFGFGAPPPRRAAAAPTDIPRRKRRGGGHRGRSPRPRVHTSTHSHPDPSSHQAPWPPGVFEKRPPPQARLRGGATGANGLRCSAFVGSLGLLCGPFAPSESRTPLGLWFFSRRFPSNVISLYICPHQLLPPNLRRPPPCRRAPRWPATGRPRATPTLSTSPPQPGRHPPHYLPTPS